MTLTFVDFDFCVEAPILDFVSLFETLKLVNWHILHCGFFKGFIHGIFKRSSHAYPTSSLHRASALSLREGVRDILDILAQCNRPRPTPAYTSSLGFSRLYMLMLGFIVIQVFVLHSYIIKI